MSGDLQDASPPDSGWMPPAEAVARPVPTSWRSLRLAWWTMAVIVVADQITKWLVVQYVPMFSSVVVIPHLVDLVHVRNTGIAFGFLNDLNHAWQSGITTGLAMVALAGILVYAKHLSPEERWTRLGLSLILGGAVGNLIDRARLG